MPSVRNSWSRSHALTVFFAVALTSLAFTLLVRLYIVPHVTPERNWYAGLTKESDSALFHTEATELASRMERLGWWTVTSLQPGRPHIHAIATAYYLTGSAEPVVFFICNALLAGWSALLLSGFLRRTGVARDAAAAGAAVLCVGPLFLFVHSELLREPLIVPSFLLFVLGLAVITARPDTARASRSRRWAWARGGLMVFAGFWGVSLMRPYLLLPLLAGLLTTLASIWAFRWWRSRSVRAELDQLVACSLLVCAVYFGTVHRRAPVVQAYRETSIAASQAHQGSGRDLDLELQQAESWETIWRNSARETELDRRTLTVPQRCTIRWRRSGWLPWSVDERLQSVACARQNFQRFCQIELLGAQADRFCDEREFHSAWDVVTHLPSAALFGLLVPFPNMWFDGFGSGGTGLRRAGYIVDGIVAYVFLLGLPLFVWYRWRTHAHLVFVALGLVAVITIYALAVPTQFILARMRLGLYLPLLAMGYAGLALAVSERMRARRG